MTRYGVDMIGVYPSDINAYCTALKAAGRDFILRNLTGTKPVTSAELTATAAAGVDTVFVYKTASSRARTGGNAAGQADATAANAALTALGVSTNCAVYFAVDEDTTGTAVAAYFQGLAAVKALAQLGVWGSYPVIDYLLSNSLVTFAMQTLAWQHGKGWHPSADLRQTARNFSVSGINCNKQELWDANGNAGQYRAGATPSPPAPPTAPSTISVPFLAAPAPLGLVFRANDDLLFILQDSSGNQLEARGRFMQRQGGLVPQYTYQDPAAYWDRVPCSQLFSNKTWADILTQCVENPTGNCATGIVCHVEDVVDATGKPIVITTYNTQGKSLATVISDVQRLTGFRWYLESRNGQWHWWCGNPANFTQWKTLRDDIDFSAETGSTLRVLDTDGELPLLVDSTGYANRVRYPATITPLALLPGASDWDDIFTEDLSRWKSYNNSGVTMSLGDKAPGYGANSVRFDYSFTMGTTGTAIPDYIDLGYIVVPGPYCDQSTNNFGNWVCVAKKLVTTDQGIAVANLPKSNVQLQLILRSGSISGPDTSANTNALINPTQLVGTSFVPVQWPVYGKVASTQDANGSALFDLTSITYMQIRAKLVNPKKFTQLGTGHVWNLTIWIDQLKPTGAPAAQNAPASSQYYVETAAVTNGTEIPIETTMDDLSLPYDDATTLASLMLASVSRPKVTVQELELRGVQPVPLFSTCDLELTRIGVTGLVYPLAEVTWLPADSGDITQLTFGDIPRDELRASEMIKHHLDRQRAQTA